MAIGKDNPTKLNLLQVQRSLGLGKYEDLGKVLGEKYANAVAEYACESRKVPEATCLMLAGLSKDTEGRDFWLRKSGLTDERLGYIAKGLGLAGVAPTNEMLAVTAEIMASPIGAGERGVVTQLKAYVRGRMEMNNGKSEK